MYKGYTGQSLEEQKDSDSEEAVSSQLTTSDSEPCAASEGEQSKESGASGTTATVSKESTERLQQSRKEQQKQTSRKEKEGIPAKRPHLDSSSDDDDEFFECEDEDKEKDEEEENEEDGEEEEEEEEEDNEEDEEMEVETIKAKVNVLSLLNIRKAFVVGLVSLQHGLLNVYCSIAFRLPVVDFQRKFLPLYHMIEIL